MKKLLLVLLLFSAVMVSAQSYFIVPRTGTTAEYVFNNLGTWYWQGNATGQPDTLLKRPLPFNFTFYG